MVIQDRLQLLLVWGASPVREALVYIMLDFSRPKLNVSHELSSRRTLMSLFVQIPPEGWKQEPGPYSSSIWVL